MRDYGTEEGGFVWPNRLGSTAEVAVGQLDHR
jgi:hypothetical protein